MNILTKNYKEFVENISLNDAEIQKTLKSADEVCDYLKSHIDDISYEIIGSFAKDTQTNTEIDVVLKSNEIKEIRKLLLEKYALTDDLTVDFKDSKVKFILGRGDEIYLSDKWVKNETLMEIKRIDESESEGRHNTRDLIKIIKHWRDFHSVDMDSYFIENEAVRFFSKTYHDTDSYLLYGFMIMSFFKYLATYSDESWIDDVEDAYEITEKGVKLDKQEDSIACFREVFGESFPETVYNLDFDEYIM